MGKRRNCYSCFHLLARKKPVAKRLLDVLKGGS